MSRLHVTVLLSLFASPALATYPMPPDSTASRPMDKAEVVIVHFGDSTCITGYLPKEQRVETVLKDRLSDFYTDQKVVSHNVAAGGDYIRQFLDSGRYKRAVKARIPHIDIALIRYGHNDQKHCEPAEFKRHLEEFCDLLGNDYPGVQIVLETNTWVDPRHHAIDPETSVKLNERMNAVWDVIRQVAKERKYPLVEIYERKKKETQAGNWDQRIRHQQLSMDKFGKRVLDGSKDNEMKDVPGWFYDNHPNANGVKIIADEEHKTITRLWPDSLLVSDPYAGAIEISKDGVVLRFPATVIRSSGCTRKRAARRSLWRRTTPTGWRSRSWAASQYRCKAATSRWCCQRRS